MPRAIDQPTLAVRVYEPGIRDGVRQKDLSVYTSARFTRERNTVGNFEVVIPLVEPNRDLLEAMRDGWMFEFWSEADTPAFLFGGYVTKVGWGMVDGKATMTVSGPSYLGWLAQRRLLGGTGSLAWAATLGGLETPGDPPSINEVMYHATTYNPNSLMPVGTAREHPWFRIPNAPQITDITDLFSTPTLTGYGIPRIANIEINAFLSGIETMDYLTGRVGERVNDDTSSVWFGMPRISYDIIRYDGLPVTGPGPIVWPSNALYLVFRVPGFGDNRSVGSDALRPVVFDVDGGGVSDAEYIEDASEVRNSLWTLGVGTKATRARYTYQDTDSMIRYGLIEDVLDAGQEGNVNVVDQKSQEFLSDRKLPKRTARFSLDAVPGQTFGYDFQFDDAVTVYWEEIGLVLNDFVSSVTCSIGGTNDGLMGIQKVQAVVGSEKLSRDSNILGRYLNGQKRGLTNLRV